MAITINQVTICRRYLKELRELEVLRSEKTSLSSEGKLLNGADAAVYLPTFRAITEATGGKEAQAPQLTEAGAFSIYVHSETPPSIIGAATPVLSGITFNLVLNASGGGTRIPLTATFSGDLVKLTTTLNGSNLKMATEAMYDLKPNAAIEILQTADTAFVQSEAFITENWENDKIRNGLIDDLGGIPYDYPQSFFEDAVAGNPDYSSQFIVLNVTYGRMLPVPSLPGYVRWQVTWKDRAYNYYQDNQYKEKVYYLPDSFQFAKGPVGQPTVSLLQFSLPDNIAEVNNARATFRIYGAPVVNNDRTQAAAGELRGKIGREPQMLSVEDAHGVNKTFSLYLPNEGATSSDLMVQPQPSIDFRKGLRNELKLNFGQFTKMWAALFSQDEENQVFRGWVDVQLSSGRFKEQVNFNARLPQADEPGFFDSILDTKARNGYKSEFTVKTFPTVFKAPSLVLQVELSFATLPKAITLTEENGAAGVPFVLEQSIRDIVLGAGIPESYPYTMKVIRSDETITCCKYVLDVKSPTLWIGTKDLAKCTEPCN